MFTRELCTVHKGTNTTNSKVVSSFTFAIPLSTYIFLQNLKERAEAERRQDLVVSGSLGIKLPNSLSKSYHTYFNILLLSLVNNSPVPCLQM